MIDTKAERMIIPARCTLNRIFTPSSKITITASISTSGLQAAACQRLRNNFMEKSLEFPLRVRPRIFLKLINLSCCGCSRSPAKGGKDGREDRREEGRTLDPGEEGEKPCVAKGLGLVLTSCCSVVTFPRKPQQVCGT